MRYLLLLTGLCAMVLGCSESTDPKTKQSAASEGGYQILDTMVDEFDDQRKKAQPENALIKYPELDCMVGLFEYNPPFILEALKAADKLGAVKLVGFDENENTLQAIIDGNCVGTVVQDPYRYGYESVRVLAALARGDRSVLPQGGFLDIPARKITADNVRQFRDELNSRLQSAEEGAASPEDGGGDEGETRPKVAFVTNGIANFWAIAKAGALAAGRDFNCDVDVRMPAAEGGRTTNQKRIVEELLTKGVDGIAISPIDPVNQQDILNRIGEQCFYITHDSDAPDTNRLLYIGMSNYDAGRMCGELVREAIPDGGEIVLFIGSLDQLNAQLRRQGVIDAVLDRPHDPSRYDPPGKVISE